MAGGISSVSGNPFGISSIPQSSNPILEGAVSSLLGLKSTAAVDTANATAAGVQVTGYTTEGNAYQTASDIAQQNAAVAGVSGQVQELQEARATRTTIGEQKAQVAASGFGASGSNLDILRASLQQGYLTQQLTRTQTTLNQGGYLEESAAAQAEKAATSVTAGAAAAAATSYTSAAALATANAANATAALNQFIGTGTLTADQQLILAPLTATPGQPTTIPSLSSTGTAESLGSTTENSSGPSETLKSFTFGRS